MAVRHLGSHYICDTHFQSKPLRPRQRIITPLIAHLDPEPMSGGIKGVIPACYLIRAIGVKEVLGRRSAIAWYERGQSDALQAYLGVNCYQVGYTVIYCTIQLFFFFFFLVPQLSFNNSSDMHGEIYY